MPFLLPSSSSPCSYWLMEGSLLSTEPGLPFPEAIPPLVLYLTWKDLESGSQVPPGASKCPVSCPEHSLIILSLVRSTAQASFVLHFLLRLETRSLLWASVIEQKSSAFEMVAVSPGSGLPALG